MKRNRRKEKGMVLVWVALTGMVLILVVALAGDTAHVYLAGHQLQNAADAAALAGVWEVRDTDKAIAHDAARDVALENNAGRKTVQLADNYGNAAGGDIVIGFYDSGSGTFTPTLASPNAVQVHARRTSDSPAGALPLIFGPALNVNSSNVSRTATAVMGGPSVEAGLILLNRQDPSTGALIGSGSNVKINIPNGAIQINSDSDNGLHWTGNPTIVAEGLFIGGVQPDAEDILVGGVLGLNSPPVDDPLGWLPIPEKGPTQTPTGTQTELEPGYYNNNFPGNRNIKLKKGIYFIDGGIDLKGNNTIDATAGVMLFLNTGSIRMGGNTGMEINPTDIAPWTGVSIYQRRGNDATALLQGTPGGISTGTMYFPSALLEISGTPDSFGTQVIADKLRVQGDGQLNLNYDGRNPIQGHRIWLAR